MEKKDVPTKILAIIGTVLVWFPILSPILFSIGFLIRSGSLHFDYLMPAEFFLFALVGGVLLIWAAFRAHSRLKLICWGLGIAVVSLFGAIGLAEVTGIASGETESTGVLFAIIVGLIAIYSLALTLVGIGGVLLLKDLFKPQPQASPVL
jgi:hypothetical protein